MASLNDPMILRQIIMDHYDNPRHHQLIEDDSKYLSIRKDSDSCIDDITMQVNINNDIIEDIRFDGVACTIATSSTSILTDLVIGKTIDEAQEIIDNYKNMIFEKDYDEDLLEEAIAFQNVHRQANRIKCATIGWDALQQLIDKYREAK
ncbi:MAG: SUF system NifU family Fe-S cluster assembly protein [Bacilli bacterium]|jgi:nitrogen fixation NifU-like protein|nr:SUF system NifU family Fe-S cluster assembly protein [Bacilli bacterium]